MLHYVFSRNLDTGATRLEEISIKPVAKADQGVFENLRVEIRAVSRRVNEPAPKAADVFG